METWAAVRSKLVPTMYQDIHHWVFQLVLSASFYKTTPTCIWCSDCGPLAFFCDGCTSQLHSTTKSIHAHYACVSLAGVTANPVLPHTGPPGTDPLAESIPRNESASIFDPPQDHIR